MRYEQGTGGGVAAQVAAEAGAAAGPGASRRLRAAPDRRRRLGSRDDRRAERRPERGLRGAELARAGGRRAERPRRPAPVESVQHLRHQRGRGVDAGAGLGAPAGRGAVVALLDSGVAYERHGRFRRAPDLRRSTFVRPYDFIEKDRHPNDVFGHGTHVAGTIAQTTNNGVGTAGIAYNAKIMPLRVLDSNGEGDSAAIARAIRYAARYHADVINLSLEFPAEVRAAEIPDVLAAIRYAHRRGRWWSRRPATRPTSPWPTRRARVGDRGRSHDDHGLPGGLLELRRGPRHRSRPVAGPMPRTPTAHGTPRTARRTRSDGRSSSRPSRAGSRASGCRAATRAPRWRPRTSRRSRRS